MHTKRTLRGEGELEGGGSWAEAFRFLAELFLEVVG